MEPGICLNYILDDLLQEHPTITIVASGVSTDVRLDFEKEGTVAAGQTRISCTRKAGRVFILVEDATSAEDKSEAVCEPLQKAPTLHCVVEKAAVEVGGLGDSNSLR